MRVTLRGHIGLRARAEERGKQGGRRRVGSVREWSFGFARPGATSTASVTTLMLAAGVRDPVAMRLMGHEREDARPLPRPRGRSPAGRGRPDGVDPGRLASGVT